MERYLHDKPLQEIIHVLCIVEIVRQRQRNVPQGRGVLPKTVGAFLDEYRCEQTLRRDMSKLWRAGVLERLGGTGARRGYRVAAA
jgi:hypothetical protein